MSKYDRVILSSRVVLPDGVRPAAIAIEDGVIVAIDESSKVDSATATDFGDSVIMPGIVDTHVHINEPGRSDWEGFETATMAAAAGGVTTLVEMPLNSIPATTTRQAFGEKVAAATGKLFVDVGFWGGLVPGNRSELEKMYEDGAFGFKCFLVPSGVPEFASVTEADLRAALPEIVRLGAVLLAHAELPGPIASATLRIRQRDARRYSTWLDSHPAAAEDEAIELVIKLSQQYGARIHIVHLSSAFALRMIREAKAERVLISVETCPHYLTIAAEEIPDGATEFKCAPPIRERSNQDELWGALEERLVDFVVTDHSPAPPALKCTDTGNYIEAWGGIASLQLSLPLLWTHARVRGFQLTDIAEWLCRGPASLAGLSRKGECKIGTQADFVVWNPEDSFEVRPNALFFRHKFTPYLGRTLFGVVRSTLLGGDEVYAAGNFPSGRRGRVLRRGEA